MVVLKMDSFLSLERGRCFKANDLVKGPISSTEDVSLVYLALSSKKIATKIPLYLPTYSNKGSSPIKMLDIYGRTDPAYPRKKTATKSYPYEPTDSSRAA